MKPEATLLPNWQMNIFTTKHISTSVHVVVASTSMNLMMGMLLDGIEIYLFQVNIPTYHGIIS
jgi:hypothetical protein